MTQNQTQLNDRSNQTIDDDEWAAAVEDLRAEYDDTYDNRVKLGAALGREVEDCPQEATSESVLQPLIRYQKISPEDVTGLIEQKFDSATTTAIRNAIIQFTS